MNDLLGHISALEGDDLLPLLFACPNGNSVGVGRIYLPDLPQGFQSVGYAFSFLTLAKFARFGLSYPQFGLSNGSHRAKS